MHPSGPSPIPPIFTSGQSQFAGAVVVGEAAGAVGTPRAGSGAVVVVGAGAADGVAAASAEGTGAALAVGVGVEVGTGRSDAGAPMLLSASSTLTGPASTPSPMTSVARSTIPEVPRSSSE